MTTIRATDKKPTANRFKHIPQTLCVLTLYLSGSAMAVQPLTLPQAVNQTLEQHPELAAYQYRLQTAKKEVIQAAASTPMSLNFQLEDAMGTGQRSGLSAMQSTLSLSWLLEQEKIDARVQVANKRVEQQQYGKQVKRIELAAQTAALYVDVLSKKQKLKLARLTQSQTSERVEQINKKVQAGKVSQIDWLRAKADLSNKSLIVEDLTHEVETAKARLAAQWSGNTQFTATGNLANIPSETNLDQAIKQLDNHPALRSYMSQRRIKTSEIQQARKEAIPAWRLSTGIRRNEAVDDFSFVAGLSIPLGAKNRNQGRIQALQAQTGRLEAEQQAWNKRVATDLLVLTHKLTHSRHQISALQSTTLPLLEQASEQAADAYKRGKYSYSDWYAVNQELLISQNELIDAYTSIHLNTIELERLSGTSISR